jgi:hypothetical protein
MPANPLAMQVEKMNESKEPPASLDENAPVMEEYEGENFPYRGIETHGVMPTVDPTDVPEWRNEGRAVPVLYVPEGVDIDPVPVRIVNTSRGEVDKWRVTTAYAGVSPVQLVNRLASRTFLKIKNLEEVAGDTVYVSPDSSVSTFSGYPIAPGEVLELHSTDEVWAVAGADETKLSVLWEFTVEVP